MKNCRLYVGHFAALLWLIVSGGFSWYATNFGNFNATYGSLGAVVGFMTWLWISAIVILLGAEVDAEMEHQTAEDTTTGSQSRWGREARAWRTPSGRRKEDKREQRAQAPTCAAA